MELNLLCPILAIAILYPPVSGHVLAQKSLTSILDDIFSPSNTERALQMINIAGTRANKNVPEIARYVSTDYVPVPAKIITGDIARNGKLPVGNEPRYITDGRYYENVCSGQTVKQANWIDLNLPKEIYQLPISTQESGRNSYIPPRTYYSTPDPYYATPNPCLPSPNPYMPVPNQYLPGSSSYLPVPNQYLPASNPYLSGSSPYLPVPNPYLPASSPMSISPYMPPPTQSKGQFLRKIPIPPPTL